MLFNCRNGHISERNKFGHCRDCATERGREYKARNREALNASARARHAKNRDRNLENFRVYAAKNKEKIAARTKEYNARPSTKALRRALKNMPTPTRDVPGNCECCGRAPRPGKGLYLDHDHESGAFRGWLCHSCNAGVGLLGDTSRGVARALAYLLFFENGNRL